MSEKWDNVELIRPDKKEPAGDFELEKSANELPDDFKKSRTKFFHNLHQKLVATAIAGFITLGAGWEKSFADHLKITASDKGRLEFVLEPSITDEKLKLFEERLRKEEPEFMHWFDEYKEGFLKSLNDYEESLEKAINTDYSAEEEYLKNQVREYIVSDQKEGGTLTESDIKEINENLNRVISINKDVLAFLHENPEFIRETTNSIRNNFDSILLGSILLDDSGIMRSKMAEFSEPPQIKFMPFHPMSLRNVAAHVIPVTEEEFQEYKKTRKLPDGEKITPHLTVTPLAFYNSDKEKLDKDLYQNLFVHEILHSIFIGSKEKEKWFNLNNLQSVLWEGITQHRTLEVIQYLRSRGNDIDPWLGTYYDDRAIIASIIESIARAGPDKDFLSKWHGTIIEDGDMIGLLRKSLKDLKLDETIADDLEMIAKGEKMIPMLTPSTDLLTTMLAKLKLNNVQLSEEFVEKILTSGRLSDDMNYSIINYATKWWIFFSSEKEKILKK